MWIEKSFFFFFFFSRIECPIGTGREQERVKGWRRETHADTELNNLSGMVWHEMDYLGDLRLITTG